MDTKRSGSLAVITIFVILACNIQYISSLRILGIFPLQGKSHFVMCERLMKGLAERGHQVDVYSHFPQKISIPNYTDYSLAGTLPAVVNNMTYEVLTNFGEVNMKMLLEIGGNPACEILGTPVFQELLKRLKEKQPYDVVIIELFASNCHLAWGRHLNIPMVGVTTSSLLDWWNEPLGNPINLAAMPGGWSGLFHPMNFWERLTNLFMYHAIVTQFNYYVREQDKYVEKYFGPGYPDVVELARDVDLMLVNDHHSMSGIRPSTPSIIPVAGLHVMDDGTKLPSVVRRWLDESRAGCIYVSFGSMVRIETFPKPVLDAFYDTFRNIAPVRVLMKIAKPEELPAGLPPNVMTQTWFSQIQVLKHKNMKAFVTHGGLMSTLESIRTGVPLVGIPLFGDQHSNIRTQVRRKAATTVDLKELSVQTLTHAIRTILNDDTYKKNVEEISKKLTDRPINPMDEAAYWIEYIVRHGKKSLRSPVVDMPWWQANLLDVYGFLLLILAVIYYTLKFTYKSMKSLCLSPKKKQSSKKVKKN